MISSSLGRRIAIITFMLVLVIPAGAYAADPGGEAVSHVAKAVGAAFTMSIAALAAGYAQSKIGPAAAGTIAERPEGAVWVVVLMALPEIIVLLGFVATIMLIGMPVAPPAG